jgi:hypothetical protein
MPKPQRIQRNAKMVSKLSHPVRFLKGVLASTQMKLKSNWQMQFRCSCFAPWVLGAKIGRETKIYLY